MSLRTFLNKNKSIVTIAGLIICVSTFSYIAYRLVQGTPPPTADVGIVWWYDLDTGKTFEAVDQIPPITVPGSSKPERGVRAYYFSCGDCADESTRFIGWLEQYTPKAREEAKQIMVPAIDTAPDAHSIYLSSRIESGVMVRAQDETEWVDINSDHFKEIMDAIRHNCGGKAANRCPGPVKTGGK